jgi:hypothetical protein
MRYKIAILLVLFSLMNDYDVTPNYPSALMLLAKWFYFFPEQ